MNKIFNYQNFSVEYIDEGIGNVVVLVHGFGEDNTIFTPQINYLKNYFRVIVPNISGIGNSSFIDKKDISIDDYATVIYQLLEYLNIPENQQMSMFGHSMGGYITLAFVEKYEKKLHSFGLIHSTAFADSEEKKQIRLRAIDTMETYGVESFLRNTIQNLFSPLSREKYKTEIENFIDHSSTFSLKTLQQFYIAMMNRVDKTVVLKQTQKPVLFIIGEKDISASMKDVLQQTHLSKTASVTILKNVAHMGMIEATTAINNILYKFLKNFED